MSGPVAEPATSSTAGARLYDSVAELQAAIASGDWAGGLLNSVSAAAEAAAFAADPLRELLAAGLGWLIEHVPQLREPFDDLAGDPVAVDAVAASWRQLAGQAAGAADELRMVVDSDTAPWRGPAVEAYRPVALALATSGAAAAMAAGAAAVAVEMAGDLVLGVRAVVRDLLAEAVADLVLTFLRNVAFAATGIGLIAVAGLLLQRAVMWAVRLGDWVRRVAEALAALRGLLARLGPVLRGTSVPPAAPRHVVAPLPTSTWEPLQGFGEPLRLDRGDLVALATETAKEASDDERGAA